jgi:hypothetical protein
MYVCICIHTHTHTHTHTPCYNPESFLCFTSSYKSFLHLTEFCCPYFPQISFKWFCEASLYYATMNVWDCTLSPTWLTDKYTQVVLGFLTLGRHRWFCRLSFWCLSYALKEVLCTRTYYFLRRTTSCWCFVVVEMYFRKYSLKTISCTFRKLWS